MRSQENLAAAAALLIGFVSFLFFANIAILNPTNIAWLDFGDMAMHQIGWMFYRDGPWGIPPGMSPNLGIETSNSIGLVDGLPLFAIPFKLLGPILPRPFQYWGWWMMLSFMLQGLFGYLLARQLGAGKIAGLVAAAFVIITPAFLFRAPLHLALGGHFLVLAALWLFVKTPAPPRWAWPVLVAITASVHAYLLAIVMGLWVFSLLQRYLLKSLSGPNVVIELAAGFVPVVIVLWLAGFLIGGTSLDSYGYGDYKLNLLSLITPNGWSLSFPDVPHEKYDYEGLAFLGIGIMAMLIIAAARGGLVALRDITLTRWWPLALAILLMAIFALSNKIAWGANDILVIPLPETLEKIASIFRSTGRFVWPLLYILTVGTVVMLASKVSLRAFVIISAIAFGLQVADTGERGSGFARFTTVAQGDHWNSPLQSPIWARAAEAGYNRLRSIPPRIQNDDWKNYSYFAVTHGMATDAPQLGRWDMTAFIDLTNKEYEVMKTGDFEPKTLYVIEPQFFDRIIPHVTLDDLFVKIDDRYVFALNGAGLADGLGIGAQSALDR